jgi:Dolichyl-phosphate-mannose-protein mannosyltransferase
MPELHSVSPAILHLNRRPAAILAALLLALLAFLLIGSALQESQAFDEANHLGAGFMYLKHGDFSRNPEHPPLVKMLAALPLLPMGLKQPPTLPIPFFKASDSFFGTQLLYSRGADWEPILMRGRMVIMLFTLGLGLLLFLATQEVFGSLAAVFALLLYISQPLLLANGNIVTTDMALACLLFASVYTFYRFCRRPSASCFALCALATCLTIVCKHSGLLVLPILLLLAISDVFLPIAEEPGTRQQRLRRSALAFCALVVLGYIAIWAIYGFRFYQLHILPPIAAYAATLSPLKGNLILFCDHHHLFPEPYLYGWVDILLIPSTRPSFLFDHIYAKPQWFFFPAAFVIKTTLAMLLLLLLLPFARVTGHRRQLVFFGIPAAFFFTVCVLSMMNGGSRYLIPVYPYCIFLAGAAAAAIFQRSTLSRVAVSALLLLGFVSTLHSYPDFLAYSNELFGGPAHTYHSLTDPDADWGQGLKWTSTYLAQHPDPNCWFDFWGSPGLNFANFNVPCKQLLSAFGRVIGLGTPPIPATISGTILISATDLDGAFWGPGDLNPYQSFRNRAPDAMIGNIILVYHGTFDVPLLAAETNSTAATVLLRQGRIPEAFALAQTAVQQAPTSADVQETYGEISLASGHIPEGQKAMATALSLAQSNYPEYQQSLIDEIQHPPPHQ